MAPYLLWGLCVVTRAWRAVSTIFRDLPRDRFRPFPGVSVIFRDFPWHEQKVEPLPSRVSERGEVRVNAKGAMQAIPSDDPFVDRRLQDDEHHVDRGGQFHLERGWGGWTAEGVPEGGTRRGLAAVRPVGTRWGPTPDPS